MCFILCNNKHKLLREELMLSYFTNEEIVSERVSNVFYICLGKKWQT